MNPSQLASDASYRKGLFRIAVLALPPIVAGLFFTRPASVPAVNAALAIVVILVSLLPLLVYLTRRDTEPMPALGVIGVFYLIAFGLPVFSAEKADFAALRPEVVTPESLLWVIGGLLLFFFGYIAATQVLFKGIRPLRLPTGYRDGWLRLLLWVLLVSHLALLWIPAIRNLPSIREFLEPAGYVAFGMFFLMWKHGRLPRVEVLLLVCVCLPMELMARFASGALLPLVMLGLFGQIVYWYYARRVPWKILLVVCLIFIPLQPVKNQFRVYTWYGGRYQNATILEKTKLFGQLAWDYYAHPQASQRGFFDSAAGRVAHIRLMALVIKQSPRPVPYWMGKTYESLPSKFIPRFLWPGKPQETISHEFGHRYSLLQPDDHETSANLPWLVETWVNFGPAGLIFGMLILGSLFGFLNRKLNRPEMTALEFVVGATVLFPLCANQEQHFATVAGNMLLLYLSLYMYFQIGFLLQPRGRQRAMAVQQAYNPVPLSAASRSLARYRERES